MQKTWIIIWKLKFENYKSRLEATELDDEINYLQENEISMDSFKIDHKQFIKNNQLILETPQWFESVRHNVFTGEINKITLSSDDDKRMLL